MNYYKVPRVSNSSMKAFLKSPRYYQWRIHNPLPDSPAFLIGRAFDVYFLEPENFDSEFFVFDQEQRPDTTKTMALKANKEWKENLISENENKDVLSVSDYELIKDMANSLQSVWKACDMPLNGSVQQVAKSEVHGIECKAKCDLIEGSIIVDVKTTNDIYSFSKSAFNYGYYRQAAFYLDLFGADSFFFAVVDKHAPHEAAIFEASKEMIDYGRQEYMGILAQIKHFRDQYGSEYEENNIWPGIDPIQPLFLPGWVKQVSF